MVEVGRYHLDWWKKFDQNAKYVSSLGSDRNQADSLLGFGKPLLFAVVTIGGEDTHELQVKLGVFLCYRNDFKEGEFRMILLSHFSTSDRQAASKAFGRLLRVTSCFKRWREKCVEKYEYFSSNCCKVEQCVSSSVGC
jgi:hypothetical protein